MGIDGYAELHCLSNFTFLRGASHPEELVKRAAELGYSFLALTDECSLGGIVRAHLAAKDDRIHLIVGSEFTLPEGLRLVLLAQDRAGYGQLCELITRGRRAAPKGRYRLTCADLETGLTGCLALWLPADNPDPEAGRWLAGRFPERIWLAIECLCRGDDRNRLQDLLGLSQALGIPALAAGDVHMHRRSRRYLQDTLTAIRLGCPLAEAGLALYPNGERYLRPISILKQRYPPELLQETLIVAERCRFSLEELRYEYPEELVPAGYTPAVYLRELTETGLNRRWPEGVPRKVRNLVEHELALIIELRYEPYFITVHDIVAFARGRSILCQGRGSAANSAVCYALGITEVDPTRMEMLFERFISRERNEPPDIDVDFEHERREEVLQYLYGKYGRERAALAATVITYRTRSALRDVGTALGLAPIQLERLTTISGWSRYREIPPERLREAGFDPESPPMRRLRHLVKELIGFPRHLSQHVGGLVLSREPLCRLVPIENAAMPERTVIQWDKDDLDALGLLKIDCLALGMLTAIRRALDLINRFRGTRLTLATIPPEDSAVYRMLQQADTIGVFQVESRAQMAMLPRLRPACFYDLVIEVAIIRPGPIQGGMVHPYLQRRQGKEPVDYPNEALRGVLERTLGVPIFQEQVMQLAVKAADFTPGEADQLRRAMAAWKRQGGLEPFRERLIEGMRVRSYQRELAERLYRQIQGFSDYGFPESHAASFALLVYVSAWLKYHEPAAFCCALLNSQPMGFYAPAQLVQDARRHGVGVRPVAVNHSDWDCTLERSSNGEPALRLGLRMVKGLSRQGSRRLVAARSDGTFSDIEDLARRAQLSSQDLKALVRADALRDLGGHRRQAAWSVLGLDRPLSLNFGVPVEIKPVLKAPQLGQELIADYASLGLSLRSHPLSLLRLHLDNQKILTARTLRELPTRRRARTAGLVINRQRPGSANGVVFLTLEDETGYVNVIVQRRLAERRYRELITARLLIVSGIIERDGKVMHLLARRLENFNVLLGQLDRQLDE